MPNFVLGAGRVYFARRTNNVLGGEKLMAETPNFGYSVDSETIEEYTSDGPTAELALSLPSKVTRTGEFACRDVNDFNLALFTLGVASSQTTAAASISDDPINGGLPLEGDTYYQLGLDAKPNVGVRGIANFVLNGTGGTPIAPNDGENYVVDLTTARLYIPPGSSAIGIVCTADYDTTAKSWGEVVSNDDGPANGALRFVSDNTTGANRDYYFPDVTLVPAGKLELKSRDKVQELGFSFSILKPSDGASVYIDGRPA